MGTREAVIVDGVRPPLGRRNGQLAHWHPTDLMAATGPAAYCASKGGVVAMTLPMARELAGAGVRVIAGPVAQVVPGGQCLPMAVAPAHRIAANAPIAVQMAKDAALASQEAGLTHERRNFVLALQIDDCREGVNAFAEEGRPTFVGR